MSRRNVQIGLVAVGLLIPLTQSERLWESFSAGRRLVDDICLRVSPTSFQLSRLQQAADDLLPEIRKQQTIAARFDIEMEQLDSETAGLRRSLISTEETIKELEQTTGRGKANNATGRFALELQSRLDHAVRKRESDTRRLAAKSQLLESRRRSYRDLIARIHESRLQRTALIDRCRRLQSELAFTELARSVEAPDGLQTRLADADRLATSLANKIGTRKRFYELERRYQD